MTAPADKRQQILDALETRLALVVTPTYNTGSGAHVFVDKTNAFDAGEVPGYNIKDGPRTRQSDAIQGTNDKKYNVLHLKIEAVATGDNATHDVRDALADAVYAIGTDETFGGLAVCTEIGDDTIEAATDEKKFATGTLNVDITYSTTRFGY